MNFELSEALQDMQRHVRDFVRERVTPLAPELDRCPRYPWETLAEMGELGLLGILTPENYGGAGLDTLSYAVLLEEVSYGDAAHATIMSVTNGLPQGMILRYGSEAQRTRYLPDLASGKHIGAFCLSEPHCRFRTRLPMTTRADKVEGGLPLKRQQSLDYFGRGGASLSGDG